MTITKTYKTILAICLYCGWLSVISCSDDTKGNAMHLELLHARAMNQDYVLFTTDSVMKEVVAYYDRYGTCHDRVEAHYLLGCAYRDMGEAPQALQCYQDAVELADTTVDCRLLIKVYGQMAEIFDAQNLPGDELSAMQKILHYARIGHDSLMYIRTLELMTKPYYKLGDTTKVVQTIWETHRLYTEIGDEKQAAGAFATLAHILVKRGQMEEADSLLKEYETKTGLFDSHGNIATTHEMYYYIKGNYFLQAGKTDSAETFFRKLLPNHYPADAYRGLLAVYQNRKDLDSVSKYAQLFEAAIDSLNNTRSIEAVHQMAELYNYHRFQQKADMEALAATKARNLANIFVVLIVLISITACAFFIWFRKSKQGELDKISKECLVVSGLLAKARMELNEERRASEKNTAVAQSLDRLENEMQEKLEEKTNEVKELENKLQQLEEHYRSATHLASMETKKNSEAVKVIRKRAEWKHGSTLPSADEWIKLTNQFRLDFPYHYATLTQGKKLATMELRTCILLLLDFKEGEIAVLLDVKPQRVTNIKKRSNMKLFGDNSATTLTSNILAATSLV